MKLDAASILGQDGRLAQRLHGYEERPQQLKMAQAVTDALKNQEHLIVEAGTGTGKSLGYLVPAILHATDPEAGTRDGGSGHRRIVVSTHTISLQEQLMGKDLPLLNSVIPREFSSVLVKGRGNYVSLRRLHNAVERAANLFFDPEYSEQVRQVALWSESTADGSLADLSFRPAPPVWEEIGSDSGNCLGRSCDFHDDCFYYRARRRSMNAQILVVNHALFFSDLALREIDVKLLPDYDAVVFDEAHTLESVASDHLGIRLTNGQIEYNLRRLYNDRTNKGLLVDGTGVHRVAQQQVDNCRTVCDSFFSELHYWIEEQGSSFNGRVTAPHVVVNRLSDQLVKLSQMVERCGKRYDDPAKIKDFTAASDRLLTLADVLNTWLRQSLTDNVYWVEQKFDRHQLPRLRLAAAPLDVGSVLREQLFQAIPSVIMTSATLATEQEDFRYFESRIGVTKAKHLSVGSPFDYQRQAKVVVLEDMPDPSAERLEFERLVAAMIERYVCETKGHAFALFTSYDMLRKVANRIASRLRDADIGIYSQAEGMPRSQMLQKFKADPRAVLLGTDSFWQGVDVPGDALQNVIITKLPFSVPDQPLLQARLEAIRESGGNPFNDFQVPEAIIKMRQGFGRLIRTRDDKGMVVILDPRIVTKYYGKRFLNALPDCPLHRHSTA